MKKSTNTFSSILIILTIVLTSALMVKPVMGEYKSSSVTATADSLAKSGIPGSIVTYTITLANTDVVDVALTLEASTAGGWPAPSLVPAALTITAGSSQAITVNAPVPASATAGQNDVATILVKDSASAIVATIQLNTSAIAPATAPANRPVVAVSSYSAGSTPIRAYQEFTLEVVFENRGQSNAKNLIVTFEGTDLFPRSTGGVSTVGNLDPGGKATLTQTFLVGANLAWQSAATIKATAVYTDNAGQAFTEAFTLTVNITPPISHTAATATPKPSLKPQLVITGYQTDIDPLQPGSIFNLKLDVKNLGLSDAKAVTLVLGGGVSSGSEIGTQQAGGVSGSSGDLTNFAPLGSSNLIFVGDIIQGSAVSINQKLVTNVTTQPGAYTLKLSFVYADSKGNRMVDDQVITLLVYSLPQVEISFYRDAGVISAGISNILPLQVTNLGKKSNILGNMKVTAENAELLNNISLVGALDPGGYFTLDSELIPNQAGPMDIVVTINYTDDFNQPRFITQTIIIEVQPAMEIDPGLEGQNGTGPEGGIPVTPTVETFWGKIARFFKGLFGLGSGIKQEVIPGMDQIPPIENINPIIVPKG
jgi:hypothetical protein